MMEKTGCVIILGLILVLGVFIAGCSSEPAATPVTTIPTTAAQAPLFVAGDIAAKLSTSTDSVWLVISYDKKADQYERTLIYKNADGTWGYRKDTKSEIFSRATMEKLYPVKITHVTVSSVPVVTPTVPTTVPTTLSGSAPSISTVTPSSAAQGSIVSVTITGSNFQNGATVKLVQSGYPPVHGTGISVSSTSITCTFSLSGLEKGSATISVTNPDGQYGDLENQFTIGEAGPIISSVSPVEGMMNATATLTITGQNFKVPVLVKLTKGTSELICTSPTTTATTTIKCNLIIGTAQPGDWTVTVMNAGGKSGSWTRMFKVTNST